MKLKSNSTFWQQKSAGKHFKKHATIAFNSYIAILKLNKEYGLFTKYVDHAWLRNVTLIFNIVIIMCNGPFYLNKRVAFNDYVSML